MAVLLITHNLEEMRAIAERAVILRRGKHVGSVALASTSDDEIVARITGSLEGQGLTQAQQAGLQVATSS